MSAPEPRGPDLQPQREVRSRSGLWASLAIVFGAMTLLGATLGVFWVSRTRGAPSAPFSASGAASSPSALPAPQSSQAGPVDPAPNFEGLGADELTPSPIGPRADPEEASSLLPVTAERPGWGTSSALATVALFGDLECPHTRRTIATVLRLNEALGERLRFSYYHAPRGDRAGARAAAVTLARVTLLHGSDAGFRVLAELARIRDPAGEQAMARWFSAASVPADLAENTRTVAGDAVIGDERLAALLDVRSTPTVFVNGRRIEGAPTEAALRRTIEQEFRAVRWLRAQGATASQSYMKRVRKNLINVEADASDRSCVPLEGAPIQGPNSALVTIVEFSDFECRHCRDLWPRLEAVLQHHGGKVRRSWRSFTSSRDPRSRRAAVFALATRATAGEGGFWALHDALLESDAELDDPRLMFFAEQLGFDSERLLAAVHDPRRMRELSIDKAVADGLDISGTPTLFVNGRRISGAVPQSVLTRVVEEELQAARRLIRAGTSPEGFQDLLCAELGSPPARFDLP